MSKNTKIIAIVGGVLILAAVIWTLVGGGFGQAFQAVGCGGKKETKPPRYNSLENAELGECFTYGHACVRDENGQTKMAAGGKECEKKPAAYCKTLWTNKCKDAAFKKGNDHGCKKFAAAADSGDADDDDDDKAEKPREADKAREADKDDDD